MTIPGLGGQQPAPLNAPPAGQVATGVQPGISNAVITANKVIVFGVNGGVFVYNGIPAAGNPPVEWLSGGTTDPFGNSLPSAGAGSQVAGNFWSALNDGSFLSAPEGVAIGFASNAEGSLPGIMKIGSGLRSLADTPAALLVKSESASGPAPQVEVQAGLEVDGTLTATGGTISLPTVITTDTWHAMPAFSAGYSHGTPAPAYKLNPDNTVSFAGQVDVASGTAGATFVTLGTSSYYPVSVKQFPVAPNNDTPATLGAPRVTIDTSGDVSFNSVSTGASNYSFNLDGIRYPLDY